MILIYINLKCKLNELAQIYIFTTKSRKFNYYDYRLPTLFSYFHFPDFRIFNLYLSLLVFIAFHLIFKNF